MLWKPYSTPKVYYFTWAQNKRGKNIDSSVIYILTRELTLSFDVDDRQFGDVSNGDSDSGIVFLKANSEKKAVDETGGGTVVSNTLATQICVPS